MKICFSDFWSPFDPNNNFFIHLLKQSFENVEVVNPEDADIMFFSVFGMENTLYKNCKKIFFTGENQRPNFKNCDYSLTFDFNDYEGKNFRLPLWYLYIDWFNVKTYDNPQWLIPESYLYGENEFTKKSKDKFCSTVFSAFYEKRINAINKLSNYKQVDVYGKYGTQLEYGERNKLNIVSDYKFSICFENSIYPGYFTEKLLHAKITGTIPLYYSDLSFDNDFNPKCCINLEEIGFDLLYEKVVEIDNNKKLYKEILEEPLFLKKIFLDPIIDNIKKTISI